MVTPSTLSLSLGPNTHPRSAVPRSLAAAPIQKPNGVGFSGAGPSAGKVLSHYGNILVQQASALKYYPAIIASLLLVTFRSMISWGSSIQARGTPQQDYVEKQAYSTTFREVGAFLGTYGLMKLFEANRKTYLLSLMGLGNQGQKLANGKWQIGPKIALQAPFTELPRIGQTLRGLGNDLKNKLLGRSVTTELYPNRLYSELQNDFTKVAPAKFLKKLNNSRFFKGWMRLSKWFDADAREISLTTANLADSKKLTTVLKAITKYAPITAGAVLATALSGVLLEWFTLHRMDRFTRWLSGAKPLTVNAFTPVAAQPMVDPRNSNTVLLSQKANHLFQQFQRAQ